MNLKITEAQVLASCKFALEQRGFCPLRINSGAARIGKRMVRMAQAGTPDLIAVVPESGRFLGCECKRPGGKLRASQVAFLANLRAIGGVGLVIDDVAKLERAIRILITDPWANLTLYGEIES